MRGNFSVISFTFSFTAITKGNNISFRGIVKLTNNHYLISNINFFRKFG